MAFLWRVLSACVVAGVMLVGGQALAADACTSAKTKVECDKKKDCGWKGKSCAAKSAAKAHAKKETAKPAKASASKATGKPAAAATAKPAPKKEAPVKASAKPAPKKEAPAKAAPAEDEMPYEDDMPAEDAPVDEDF